MSEVKRNIRSEVTTLLDDYRNLNHPQQKRLTRLTAQQAGYWAKHSGHGYGDHKMYTVYSPDDKEFWRGTTTNEDSALEALPTFAEDVNACLNLLPVPDEAMWTLITGKGYASSANLWSVRMRNEQGQFERYAYAEADTLPLAILKAWWSIQEDESA